MIEAMDALLSLVAVLVGAGITYVFNVRSRRDQKIEDAFHRALASVGALQASQQFVTDTGLGGGSLTPSTQVRLAEELQVDGHKQFAVALRTARIDVAAAGAYDEELSRYTSMSPQEYLESLDAIVSRIRRDLRIGHRKIEKLRS